MRGYGVVSGVGVIFSFFFDHREKGLNNILRIVICIIRGPCYF